MFGRDIEQVIDQRVRDNKTEVLVKYTDSEDKEWTTYDSAKDTAAYEYYCSSQEFIAQEILEENEDGTAFLVRWEKQVEPTWEEKENIDDCAAYEKWIARRKRRRDDSNEREAKRVKVEQTELGGFSESDSSDSEVPIVLSPLKKKKTGRIKVRQGHCSDCGLTESASFISGRCSACYQQWKKERDKDMVKVKEELEQKQEERLRIKEESAGQKRCENCFSTDPGLMWRGDLCDRCFKGKVKRKMRVKKKKSRKPPEPDMPDHWKKQAAEKARATQKAKPMVPDHWKKRKPEISKIPSKSKFPPVNPIKRKLMQKPPPPKPPPPQPKRIDKPAVKKSRPRLKEADKPAPPRSTEVAKKKIKQASNPPPKKKKLLKVKAEGGTKSGGIYKTWTEEDFYLVIGMMKENASWHDIAKEIGNVDAQRVEKYFKKFKKWANPIFQQDTQFNWVGWNRPSQKWLVNVYSVYIDRCDNEDQAAALADAVCSDVDPHFKQHNLLPKTDDEVQKLLKGIPSWQTKRKKILEKSSFKNRNQPKKPKKRKKPIAASEGGAKKKRKLPKTKKKADHSRKAQSESISLKQKTKKKKKLQIAVHSESSDSDEDAVLPQRLKAKKSKPKRIPSASPPSSLSHKQDIILEDDIFPDFEDDEAIDEIPKPTPPSEAVPDKQLIPKIVKASNGVVRFSIPKKRTIRMKKLLRPTRNKIKMKSGRIPKKPSGASGAGKKFPGHWKPGIAFTERDNILICAECDWQFTYSLARGIGTGKRIVSTCYKEATDCPNKYGLSAFDRKGRCESLGVTIVEHVDITNPEILIPVMRKNFGPEGLVRIAVPFILHSHSSSREKNKELIRGLFKSMKQCKRISQVDLILHRKKMSGDGQFEYWNVESIALRQGFVHSNGYKMLFKDSGKNGGESVDFPDYFPSSESGQRIWPNFPQLGFFHSFRRKVEVDENKIWPKPAKRTESGEKYASTIIVTEPDGTKLELENRIENRGRVERKKLHEFGMHPDVCLILNRQGVILFKGYERIVYGDHGPYLEFLEHNIMFKHFGPSIPGNYYNRRYPHTSGEKIKLYCQKKSVHDRPNPPKGRYSVNNERPEGYADYRAGRFYVDPLNHFLQFIFPCPKEKNIEFLDSIKNRRRRSYSHNSEPPVSARRQHRSHRPSAPWPSASHAANIYQAGGATQHFVPVAAQYPTTAAGVWPSEGY